MTDKEYLANAATTVLLQAAQTPGAAIPVDPDVADFMGAFKEEALIPQDMLDDALLVINEAGEACHVEN